MKRPRRLRGLSAQLLLFVGLPLFLVLSGLAVGSVIAHQHSMRTIISQRDLRAALTGAAGLSTPTGLPNEQKVQAVLAGLQASPGTVVLLVNAQGRIVFDVNPQDAGQAATPPGVAQALAGQSGLLYQSVRPGGPEYVVAYAPVRVLAANGQAANWALIVEDPRVEVLSPWLRLTLFAPLIMVVAVASTLVALWIGVQRVVHPLQQLDAQVAALGEGDFAAVDVPVGGIEEIQTLQEALVRMAAQIQTYQQSMRDYLGAVTAAQEDERKRLARDLHDQTVQDLIALKQRVQMARRKTTGDRALEARLAELQTMLETTMDEVRRFSRALRPIYLEEAGLVAALEAMARDAAQHGMPPGGAQQGLDGGARQDALQVSFEVEGEPRRLAPEVELALYRIVQEALHNIARHAQASNVRVSVEFGEGIIIRVEDDGVGFAVPVRISDLAMAGHYGLMGMQERAQLVGARLVVHSRPGAGTKIDVQWHPGDAGTQADFG
jgi:signal transduction histidine kinase